MGAELRDRARDGAPASVDARARENLEFIRTTMANSASFTGVPGLGMVAMGLIALAGGYIATRQDDAERWLLCWIAVAFAGCLTGIAAMVLKARVRKVALWRGAGRRFLMNFSPAIIAGMVLGEALYQSQPDYAVSVDKVMPAMWLLLYGAAVISGGAFSVRPVSIVGVCFMVAGLVTLVLPTDLLALPGAVRPYDLVLAAAFGGLHIGFGAVIAAKHGG